MCWSQPYFLMAWVNICLHVSEGEEQSVEINVSLAFNMNCPSKSQNVCFLEAGTSQFGQVTHLLSGGVCTFGANANIGENSPIGGTRTIFMWNELIILH